MWPPLTTEVVATAIDAARASIRHALDAAVRLAASDKTIGRLEIDLQPALAAYRCPLQVYAWTHDRRDPRSDAAAAVCHVFDGQLPILSADFKRLPLGRDDIGGLDFTPETRLVTDALLGELTAWWSSARPTIAVFASVDSHFVDDADQLSLLNLATGAWEVVIQTSE